MPFLLRQMGAAAPERVDGLQSAVPDITRDPSLILQLAHQVLGMSATFYARLDAHHMTLVQTYRDPSHHAAPMVTDGAVVPLSDTYCQFVYRSAQPLVVTEAHVTAPFDTLATTRDLGIGSYVGVPLIGKDGTVLGTLCGLDEESVAITAEQVATLQLLGQALVAGMEHQALLDELERQRATALLALRDALTGLPNRRAFDSALEAGIARAAIDHQPIALLFMDIDHFKQVNDTYGHEVGDVALRFVTARLARALRGDDQLFRFGGEELVALLPNVTPTAALATAQRLRRALRHTRTTTDHALDGRPLHLPQDLALTVSIGVAVYPTDAASSIELLRRADAAMYHAKHTGRDRCCAAHKVALDAHLPNTETYTVGAAAQSTITNGLVAALGAHDPTTGEHSDRMTDLTERLMNGLGGTTEMTRLAGEAARLHDIGKIGVAATILTKNAPLTGEEWQIVQRHPSIGERILQECGGALALIAQVVGAHHERWDGTGYPLGLRGEAIPLAARVIAVVDAFDAMTSDRPYRRAMSLAEAVAELQNGAGTQFDPAVVAMFLDEVATTDDTLPQAA